MKKQRSPTILTLDMFSGEYTQPVSLRGGYAGNIGAGPEGETCKTCSHLICFSYSRKYYKCGLGRITHGAATDIKVRTKACNFWESD